MDVPEWVFDSVFYQIFPDRFANGDPGNDPANVQPWGSPPNYWGFQGGDLRGVLQRLDYLQDLGSMW
jgi:cyclomaltodextrinase / maltogenic alpha-amylase / neopullulanase